MKCLSVRQPFATFIVNGEKTIETRLWPTNYRGPLLIVSSLKFHGGHYLFFDRHGRHEVECHHLDKTDFLTGYALGVVDLVDCRRMAEADEQAAACEFYEGAFSWILENPRQIGEFPMRGQLRLWDYHGPEPYFLPG